MKTTLFIPTYNEIEGVKEIMPRIKKEWVDEIIIIDANSTDGTREYLEKEGYFVVTQRLKGICGAYWECLRVATGDIIIPFSPDNNSIPELIPVLINKMKEGYDMVIVSRYVDGAHSYDDDPITAFGNWLFTKMVNLLFGGKYTDVLVMFRAFKKEIVKTLQIDVKKYPVFEIQLGIRCAKRKLKVTDIPGDEPKRIGGARKMHPLYNGLAILCLIIREIFVWR
jgi:glycosyltransferase involved in cell wall biosynthesis